MAALCVALLAASCDNVVNLQVWITNDSPYDVVVSMYAIEPQLVPAGASGLAYEATSWPTGRVARSFAVMSADCDILALVDGDYQRVLVMVVGDGAIEVEKEAYLTDLVPRRVISKTDQCPRYGHDPSG